MKIKGSLHITKSGSNHWKLILKNASIKVSEELNKKIWISHLHEATENITVNVGAENFFCVGGSSDTLWLNVNEDTEDLLCALSEDKQAVRQKAENMAEAIKAFNRKYKDVN